MNIQDLIIPYEELTPEKARDGCFVTDMPNDAYHAYEGISVSGLKQIMQSPAHYAYSEPKQKTTFMILGTAIHCAILEPERYQNEYLRLEDCKDRRQAQYKDAVKSVGEELVLITSDVEKVKMMQSAVFASKAASHYLSQNGWSELSGFVECPNTGVIRRIRFDRLTENLVSLDLKKCQDARPEAFERSIFNYGYHIQAAFYNDTFKLIAGRPLEAFKFLAIEEKMPHGSKVYTCDDVSMYIGRKQYKEALLTYGECDRFDDWPSYIDEEQEIGIPTWAVNKFMDQEEEGNQ